MSVCEREDGRFETVELPNLLGSAIGLQEPVYPYLCTLIKGLSFASS